MRKRDSEKEKDKEKKRESARSHHICSETMPSAYMKWLEANRPMNGKGETWEAQDYCGLLLGFGSHVTCHRVREH